MADPWGAGLAKCCLLKTAHHRFITSNFYFFLIVKRNATFLSEDLGARECFFRMRVESDRNRHGEAKKLSSTENGRFTAWIVYQIAPAMRHVDSILSESSRDGVVDNGNLRANQHVYGGTRI